VRGLTADELIRQAESALHRAKANGKRQWAMYEEQRDSRDRDRFTLAASMSGGLENGEFSLMYEPQVQLASRQIVAIEAMLEWNHPEHGVLPHDRCMELADLTGMVLPLGEWLLRMASEQAVKWRTELRDFPTLSVQLAPAQAKDPDLVSTVRTVLSDTGLPVRSLRLGIPVRSLINDELDDAENNLEVLTEMGVQTALAGFGGCDGGLAPVADHPVQAVTLTPCLVARLATRPVPITVRGATDLVQLMRESGASVIVPGIQSEAQAAWWLELGADIGQGDFFAAPAAADEIPRILAT
jgi:EAL domain-containing protein (putative c-di-GMP-specific phosphodiesterase class I)